MSIFNKISIYFKVKKIINKIKKKELTGADIYSAFAFLIKKAGLDNTEQDIFQNGKAGTETSEKLVVSLQRFFSMLLARVKEDKKLTWEEFLTSLEKELKKSNIWDKKLGSENGESS